MHKRIMNLQRAIHIGGANFSSWIRSPRTICMIVFACIFVWSDSLNAIELVSFHPTGLHWSEAVCWQLSQGADVLTLGVLFLITITELPNKTQFHNPMLMRSKRTTWLLGQVAYCLCMSLFFVGMIALMSSVSLRFQFAPGRGWSESLPISEGAMMEADALIRGKLREHFTPATAAMVSLVPLILFFFTMSLTVMVFTFLNAPVVGSLLYMFLLLAQQVIQVELIPWIRTPMRYATLANILGRDPATSLSRVGESILVYAGVLTLLNTALFTKVKRMDLFY